METSAFKQTCCWAPLRRSDGPCYRLERQRSVQVGQTAEKRLGCCLLAKEHPDFRDHRQITALL